jgi:MFS transporter, PAT family, beta-lactamase induction signal transducer AmpG
LTEPVVVPSRPPGWLDAVRVYARPRLLSMLALGFSSGLPFMLIYSTMSAWLRQEGIERKTISALSLVGLAYSFKYLWSPIVDRMRLPLIGRGLGQRRSWMLLTQLCIGATLLVISAGDPAADVRHLAMVTLLLAIAAATQDIAVDAWRIESSTLDEQGPMAAAYQFGYRTAILASQGGALWIAGDYGWHQSYRVMAMLALVGVVTTLLVREPERRAPVESFDSEQRVVDWLRRRPHWPQSLRQAGAWLLGAIVCPVMDFFVRYGWALGLLLFAFISTYRMTDYTMGVMANTLYIDLHFTLKQVAAVAKLYGTVLTFIGVIAGGAAVTRLGRVRSLFLGSALIILSSICYALFAAQGQPSLIGLATVISVDNFAQGVHGTALIAFMSTLTSARYTATQYAVLSSIYTIPGKLLMSRSGDIVTSIGYPHFYTYTAALSIPALLVLVVMTRRQDFKQLVSRWMVVKST